MNVVRWKSLKRHPLSEEMGDMSPAERQVTIAGLKEHGNLGKRKVVLHEGMVLDGWQFYQCCLEAGVHPLFEKLPAKTDPKAYVRVHNINRRHSSDRARELQLRAEIERIAAARQDGKSIRTIAEEEDLSPATVMHRLEQATVQGLNSEPETGKIAGKDGRQQPAKKPRELVCASCIRMQRVGQTPPAKCADCKELLKAKRQPGDEPKRTKSTQGKLLFDFAKFETHFGHVRRAVDELYKAFKVSQDTPHKQMREHLAEFLKLLKERHKQLKREAVSAA